MAAQFPSIPRLHIGATAPPCRDWDRNPKGTNDDTERQSRNSRPQVVDRRRRRLATVLAETLSGKRSPWFTRHTDTGDFVVVVNAEKVAVTGKKMTDKKYYRHSGYPGGIKERTLAQQLERRPEEVLRMAVRGMLPKNRLGRQQLMKLKIYAGGEHPHTAQKPEPLRLTRKAEV